MVYEYITKFDSPNFTSGRDGRKIKEIIIHHWGDPAQKPQFQNVVNWLCLKRAQVSAHYVLEAGKVACLVACKDTAWHAGNWNVNLTSIGIECNPRCTAGDRETLAELIAVLRETYGYLPLRGHQQVAATGCPGAYQQWLPWLDKRAEELRGQTSGGSGSATPAPTPAPKPTPAPAPSASFVTYLVKAGDSPWSIAARVLGDGARYREIMALSGIAAPYTIHAGQTLKIPADNLREYTVQPGDSPWGIAVMTLGDGGRYLEIAKINGLVPPYTIHTGQKLLIPRR